MNIADGIIVAVMCVRLYVRETILELADKIGLRNSGFRRRYFNRSVGLALRILNRIEVFELNVEEQLWVTTARKRMFELLVGSIEAE